MLLVVYFVCLYVVLVGTVLILIHYENAPRILYTDISQSVKLKIFVRKKNIFNFLAQKHCGYTLERLAEAVLTSTHNVCFGSNIRKKEYLCKPQFFYINCMDMFS